MSLFTRTIHNKILAVILVAVVSAVLVASIGAAVRQASRQFEAKQDEVQGIAAAMATTIARPTAQGDRHQVAATLNAISRIPGFSYARATNAAGTVLFEHGAGIVIQRNVHRNPANERIGLLSAIYLGTYMIETPVIYGGKPIGELALIADLSSLRHALIESLMLSLAFGVLAGAIGTGAALLLQRSITAPINALTQTMKEVRETGDFTRTAIRRSNDETGLMVDTFNDMLAKIRERDAALSRHRDELEATVERRTSDLRVAKIAAEEANAAKSDFLATMSHEIRTPMNGMLVMAELLSASSLAPRLQRYADVIVKSGNGLLAIINDILDFSKIEAGKLELESIAVDPRRLVDDTLQLFSERAVSANLEIAAYVAPDVPRQIIADPVRLGQVLTNLVNNALKFTETGGVLACVEVDNHVDANSESIGLRFSIRDTGVGIPQQKIASIFDAFAQADRSTTRQFGGTGIGLTICRRLIDAMGGQLTVSSKVGVGSTFSFAVPFPIHEPAQVRHTSGATSTALVALNDGVARDALLRALNDRGIKPLFPGTAESNDIVDFVICDVTHPDLGADTAVPFGFETPLPTIALADLGDTHGDHLAQNGTIARLLDRPLSVIELAETLDLAATAPERLGEAEHSQRTPSGAVASSFNGIHVLAADDSPVNREVLSEVLKRLDVQLTSVEDGVAAVSAAKTGNYDLIFMDGSMPLLDGFEATRQIRAWEDEQGCNAIPIIALTAHVIGEYGDKWRDVGMTDFVSKPFTLAQIETCLRNCLPAQEDSIVATLEETAPDAPNSADCVLIDHDVLSAIREMQGPGDNLVARIIDLYVENASLTLSKIMEVKSKAKPTEIAELAHALKSLSRNVGAVWVGDLADVIEASARDNNQAPSAAELDALHAALSETLKILQQMSDDEVAAA